MDFVPKYVTACRPLWGATYHSEKRFDKRGYQLTGELNSLQNLCYLGTHPWLCYFRIQEDIDEGYVYNTADLEGWSPPPGAVKFTTQDAEAVKIPRQMSISVERTLVQISTSEGLDSTFSDEGDTATFRITVTNTGNTVLRSVKLTDSTVEAEAIVCDQDFTTSDSKFLPSSHPSGVPLVCIVSVPMNASYVDAGGFDGTSEVGWMTDGGYKSSLVLQPVPAKLS